MNLSLDWPQSASSLLAQARHTVSGSGELVKLIMAGTLQVDSWIIENRILPALHDKHLKAIRFHQAQTDREARSAHLVPLPDGSAFACSADHLWTAMEAEDARREIEYIGLRYAPRNHWVDGFEAFLQPLGDNPQPATPAEVAAWWMDITGSRPRGYEAGLLDQIQSVSIDVMDKAFNVQGLLGL